MKSIIAAALFVTSFNSFANDQDAYLKLTRQCYEEVTIQISIDLSQAVHGAKPGSKEESRAQARLDQFIDDSHTFPMMETGCHETAPNGKETACKIEGYETEIKRLAKKYKAREVVKSTLACKLLN